MFNRHGKTTKSNSTKRLENLITISAPGQLFSEGKRPELLQKIKEFSALETARFDLVGLSLIHNIGNHYQSLPETANSYYTLPGGLLDHALNRTEAALELFYQYVEQEGPSLSEEQKLWLYALFSASMIQGIGKLQIDYRVELYDPNGHWLKTWNPLLESLASAASHYHYQFQQEHDETLRRLLNILLSRMVMPSQGFAWISSNPQVLAVWLALLHEDWQSAGTLGAILIRADAIAIQRYFSDLIARNRAIRGGRFGRISTFIDIAPESINEKECMVGLQFLEWLTQQLASGQIMINKAPLYMVPGGMLMSVDIFKWFVREHPEYKNWQAIQNGFLALNLHTIDAEGNITARFEQAQTQQMVSGIVFANYAVALPETVKVHQSNTGKAVTMSATELINIAQTGSHFITPVNQAHPNSLKHLATTGQWQQLNATTPLQPGSKHGG